MYTTSMPLNSKDEIISSFKLTSPLKNGLPTSGDIHRIAVRMLADFRFKYPNIQFPIWFYASEYFASRVSPQKVFSHYQKTLDECTYRISHPDIYSVHAVKPTTKLVYPVTPLNEIFKTPVSMFKPTLSLATPQLPVFAPSCLIETPIQQEIKHPSPTKALDLSSFIDYKPIEPESEKVSPVEEEITPDKDPSPIRISIDGPEQRGTILPPLDHLHYTHLYNGPHHYHWIFVGFSLCHLLGEARAGFPLLASCSNQVLRHLIVDLKEFRLVINEILCVKDRTVDSETTYGEAMSEYSLADIDDSLAYLESNGTIFHTMRRSDLSKVLIDLDDIFTYLNDLMQQSSFSRERSFSNQEIYEHVERIRSYKP